MLIKSKILKRIKFSCLYTFKRCIILLINVKTPTNVDILTFMSCDGVIFIFVPVVGDGDHARIQKVLSEKRLFLCFVVFFKKKLKRG